MTPRIVLVVLVALVAAACERRESGFLQGYGEADYVYVSSQDAGIVAEVLVREGDAVTAGQALFALNPDRLTYSADSAGAEAAAAAAAVSTARANLLLAQRNYDRGAALLERGFYPRANLDADRAALDAARAALEQAQRQARSANANTGLARERLSDLGGVAPVAGTVERIFHRGGEVVAAGQPIIALLAPENMKVRFFAPEPMLSQLRVGSRVLVRCDGEGCGEALPATVSFIARDPQFTPPIIYSLDQREKLVFLVEARLDDASGPIRPGMPVDVEIAPP
jgi:HlyD family secretion protein